MNKTTFCEKRMIENQYSSSNHKNQEHRNIAPLSLQIGIYRNTQAINDIKHDACPLLSGDCHLEIKFHLNCGCQ